jgi:hypothetical protein
MGTSAPKPVVARVERFERARKVFLSPDYKEEQLRAVCLTIWRSTFGARTFHAEFLGKVIRLTAGHQAKVEEKPEVPAGLNPDPPSAGFDLSWSPHPAWT